MQLSITTVTIVYRLSTVVVQKEGEKGDALIDHYCHYCLQTVHRRCTEGRRNKRCTYRSLLSLLSTDCPPVVVQEEGEIRDALIDHCCHYCLQTVHCRCTEGRRNKRCSYRSLLSLLSTDCPLSLYRRKEK